LPDDFEILCGDDALTLDFMKAGAVGVVSVASNIIPAAIAELVGSGIQGQWGEAEAVHNKYAGLFSDFLTLDTNPVPIKAALGLSGKCLPKLRLPMVEMPEEKVEELKGTLTALGLV
ncbi:MAG: dihydrodipicolinate synthase family protein, partial [Verrucomicrobiota bacterium]